MSDESETPQADDYPADLPPAALRALAEAEERRKAAKAELPTELGGRDGPEPIHKSRAHHATSFNVSGSPAAMKVARLAGESIEVRRLRGNRRRERAPGAVGVRTCDAGADKFVELTALEQAALLHQQAATGQRHAVGRIRRQPAGPHRARRVAEHRAAVELLRVAEYRPELNFVAHGVLLD